MNYEVERRQIEEQETTTEIDVVELRKQERRKRRRRNQRMAYLGAGGAILVMVVLIVACVKLTLSHHATKVEQEAVLIEETIAGMSEEEAEIVIAPPSEEEIAVQQEDYLEEVVDACIAEMPLEDKIAQLFIVTPESVTGSSKVTQAGDKTKEVIQANPVGGFIYFGQNLENKEQVMNMISATAGYNLYDMFFVVDEEGGEVSRVSKSAIEVPEVGPMKAVGETQDAQKAYEVGTTVGQYLHELGFNVNLAPVADVITVEKDSAIGDRSFGSDPVMVGQMVQKCVEGLQNEGVSACVKHFPGLGDTVTDTHEERVVIDKSLEELQATNYVSFQQAIEAGVDFVMVSHATATAIDEVYPCSLSREVVSGQLREQLGYNGIVITDAFNMKAITEYYTTKEACVRAIKAGVDMILMPQGYEEGYQAVLEAVQAGSIPEERIDQSLRRIHRVKKRDVLEK